MSLLVMSGDIFNVSVLQQLRFANHTLFGYFCCNLVV